MSNSENNVPLENHEYDGIQELDNPAPFWWQMFFFISIAFGIGYYAYYELMDGPSSDKELSVALSKINDLKQTTAGSGPTETEFLAALANPERLGKGAAVYAGKCASCHSVDGGGLIGPNLTDDYWIHGKGATGDIYTVVKAGVLEKGMPPWDAILSRDEMVGVVAYVKSLHGKTSANPKAPQGTKATN